MSDYIKLSYSNGTESAQIGDVITSSNLPIGTWFTEILNANMEEIARRISACKLPSRDTNVHNRHSIPFDFIKFQIVLDSLCKDYPHIFSFYQTSTIIDAWYNAEHEFCFPTDTNLVIVEYIGKFKTFLDELIENPKLFSFDFLEYLNIIGAIPPFSVNQCLILNNHHEQGKQSTVNNSLCELYDIFSNIDSLQTTKYLYSFMTRSFLCCHILVCSLLEIARQGKTVKKCQNCGKYFIPTKRSDTLYCDNPSPMAPEMTCKEYGTRRLWYEKQKEDNLATLSRKIASAKGMLAKRNPDIPEYTASYNYFKEQRLIWIKAVKNGTKTQDEYRAWLELMQKSKVIKEALNGSK